MENIINEYLPICRNCINFTPNAHDVGIFYCKAFPNGIPVDPRPNVTPGTVVGSTSTALANSILAGGVAVMGSGFPVQGWNLDEAVKTNVELIGIFKKTFTKTNKVVAKMITN